MTSASFFYPLEKSDGFFWSIVTNNTNIYSTSFQYYPDSLSKGRFNFQYCFLLSRKTWVQNQVINQQTVRRVLWVSLTASSARFIAEFSLLYGFILNELTNKQKMSVKVILILIWLFQITNQNEPWQTVSFSLVATGR